MVRAGCKGEATAGVQTGSSHRERSGSRRAALHSPVRKFHVQRPDAAVEPPPQSLELAGRTLIASAI
jgi:hypothetical protein